jgi:hypothetical protein
MLWGPGRRGSFRRGWAQSRAGSRYKIRLWRTTGVSHRRTHGLLPSELAYVSMANVTCLSSETNSVAAIEQDWQGLPVVPTLCTEFGVD